jgi:NodT family efflux transporter outer membrane factor (OMF) lipoprotein
VFGEPQLNELMERLEKANPTLAAAESRYVAARALAGAARAGLYPQVAGQITVERSRSAGTRAAPGTTETARTAAVAATWELDFWGRVRRQVESSDALAQASAADLATARLLLQGELAADYFLLRVLDAQRRLFEDTAGEYRRSALLTERRFRVGVAGKADVAQADVQLKTTLAQTVDLDVQRALLEHAIAVLIGTPPATFAIEPQPSFTPRLPVLPPGLPSTLLERRPDIAAAERRVAAANAQIGVARAAFFPLVTLNGVFGYDSTEPSWLSAPHRFWAIGPSLVQYLFDGGLRRSQAEATVALWNAAAADYRAVVLFAFQEIEDSLATLRILEQEADLQRQAVEASRESARLTLNQYQAGTVSYLNVVTVQTSALANERTALDILGRRLVASVQLVRALGGGWSAADLDALERGRR